MQTFYINSCVPICTHTVQRARATTKRIESPADLEGFPELADTEKDEIKQLIQGRTCQIWLGQSAKWLDIGAVGRLND